MTEADVQGKSQATTAAVTREDDALAQQTEFKDEIKKLNTTVTTREQKNCELE